MSLSLPLGLIQVSCSTGWSPQSSYAAKDDLELLYPCPWYWDYRHVPLCPALSVIETEPRSSRVHRRQALYQSNPYPQITDFFQPPKPIKLSTNSERSTALSSPTDNLVFSMDVGLSLLHPFTNRFFFPWEIVMHAHPTVCFRFQIKCCSPRKLLPAAAPTQFLNWPFSIACICWHSTCYLGYLFSVFQSKQDSLWEPDCQYTVAGWKNKPKDKLSLHTCVLS